MNSEKKVKMGLETNVEICKYTKSELNNVTELVMRIHEQLIGIPMTSECHKMFHKYYGRHDDTYEQILEFKEYYNKNII